MIQIMKKNKIFALLIIITILTILGSIILISILDEKTKTEISKKAILIIKSKEIQKTIIEKGSLPKTFSQNIFLFLTSWILGISIIGIPLILFFYLLKILLFTWNIFFLFQYLELNSILFILLYLIPKLITLIILLISTYYAISYSTLLIKILFFKKNYSIQRITKNYIKILIKVLIIILLQSILEVYLLPKIFLLI